jgi:hypothetical protein
MRRSWPVVLVFMAGCGPVLPGAQSGGGTADETATSDPMTDDGRPPPSTSTTGTSPPPPPGTTATTATDPTAGTIGDPEDSSGGSTFIQIPDGGGICHLCCDLWAQDCPRGEKCTAWATDGGEVWNGMRCYPIHDNPGQPGDPCTIEDSPTSGFDDCDLGVMCWDVDPDTLEGTCVALCTGSGNNPQCEDPDTDCLIANDGVLNLCLPSCDPLGNGCGAEQACVASDQGFVCVPVPQGGGAAEGEACQLVYDCLPGAMCWPSASVGPPCDEEAGGCCTPLCDLSLPNPTADCLDPGQICASAWGENPPPVGYENVGVCIVP